MARVELVVGLLVTVLWIYSIVNCALTPESGVRGIPKAAWLVLIVLVPLLGSVLWLGVGRVAGPPRLPKRTAAASAAPSPSPGAGYSSLTVDERIRRMEEDLARLEQEGRDPDGPERRPGRA